jgi:threonine/homoserine/homoserine lactone efflux protein
MLLLKGLLIGLSIAATVGPMSMLCIQRTLERGRLVGMFSGLGIATADGLYALVAGLGLSAIMHLLISQQFWIRLVGGLFLFYLGLKTMLMRKVASASSVQARTKQLAALTGFIGMYLSMLLLTLANPLTILSFVVIFAGVGIGGAHAGSGNALLLVLGVFLGSVCWWLILTSVVGFIRTRLNVRLLLWINRASGVILLIFGIIALTGV